MGMEITAKDGLLWRNGKFIPLPEADDIARQYGQWHEGRIVPFAWAEQLVRALDSGIVPEKVNQEKA